MTPITLILVNGFLGAGKTTLLAAAAKRLLARGRRVAVITNDQAAELVDTFNLRQQGLDVAEVAGGCFCCQFDGLMHALDGLFAAGATPDVVLAEAVGSCTDLAATVIQPLKDLHADRIRAAPYSVVVDATRLRNAATLAGEGSLGGDVLYIFDRQVEEADLLLLNKLDLVSPAEAVALEAELRRRHPGSTILAISAREGRGIDAWLDAVLAGGDAGARLLEIDYDRYAAGEAELGWLNARATFAFAGEAAEVATDLLARLRDACAARGAAIAHLKLALAAPGGSVIAALPADDAAISATVIGSPAAGTAALVLNARVRIDPEELRTLVAAELAGLGATVHEIAAFRPGRPEPKHRYNQVV